MGWSGLAHLTPPGFDPAFKPTLNGAVFGLWKQGSTLYVVGAFSQVNGLPRGGGAAFDLTTGGLLPKVIAAYNAGPMSLPKWNMGPRANADPLLYIESIPYAETRAYVVLVLRNYWMYQREAGEPSASLTALAQGLWPKFPGMPGTTAIRIQHAGLTRAD